PRLSKEPDNAPRLGYSLSNNLLALCFTISRRLPVRLPLAITARTRASPLTTRCSSQSPSSLSTLPSRCPPPRPKKSIVYGFRNLPKKGRPTDHGPAVLSGSPAQFAGT